MAKHDVSKIGETSEYISGSFYNLLKFLSLVAFPAAATLYAALAPVWNLPDVQEVVLTVTSIDTFLGVLIGATPNPNKLDKRYSGSINVSNSPDGNKKTYSLDLDEDPEALDTKNHVVFRVNRRPSPR